VGFGYFGVGGGAGRGRVVLKVVCPGDDAVGYGWVGVVRVGVEVVVMGVGGGGGWGWGLGETVPALDYFLHFLHIFDQHAHSSLKLVDGAILLVYFLLE
jgi:hypothetical protein